MSNSRSYYKAIAHRPSVRERVSVLLTNQHTAIAVYGNTLCFVFSSHSFLRARSFLLTYAHLAPHTMFCPSSTNKGRQSGLLQGHYLALTMQHTYTHTHARAHAHMLLHTDQQGQAERALQLPAALQPRPHLCDRQDKGEI